MILPTGDLSRLIQEQGMPTGELNRLIAGLSRETGEMSRERREMEALDRR